MNEELRDGRPNPCNGCEDRYPACSGHCEKPAFISWKAEQELIRKNRSKYICPIWKHAGRDYKGWK